MSITITEFRNAVSTNDDDTNIELEIKHPTHGWIPYGIDPDDSDATIDNDALLKLIGSNFTKLSKDEKDKREADAQRVIRNTRLENEVDPLVTNPIRWAELTNDQQTAWTKYRTDLFNVPQQSGFPLTHTFPTKP